MDIQDLSESDNTTNTSNIAIIGDTVAATLYAKRLLNNGIMDKIYIISEGVNRIKGQNINNMFFTQNNKQKILKYLSSEKIHILESNSCKQRERMINYHIGSGSLGDFIGAYHIPRVGPWFSKSVSGNLGRFLYGTTVKSELTAQESIIVNRLQDILGIPATDELIVNTPSILNVHYEFLQMDKELLSRELFLKQHSFVNMSNNCTYIDKCKNLEFKETKEAKNGNKLYDISGKNIKLKGVKAIWKINQFTYLRVASEGGLKQIPQLTPTFYRATLTIPQINGEMINLSCLPGTEDLLTTHISFSLYDISKPQHTYVTLPWLVEAYTTCEDMSIVNEDSKYAESGKTLLIVEGVSTINKRSAIYNIEEGEVQIKYNDPLTENEYLRQFSLIVVSIYKAYTGKIMTAESLIEESSRTKNGDKLVDYALRESPMVSIMQLASNMYGGGIY